MISINQHNVTLTWLRKDKRSKRDVYRLENNLVVPINGWWDIKVPAGYETDGASIPRWAWSIVGTPGDSQFRIPSLVHDWLCDDAASQKQWRLRAVADAVFWYLLGGFGVSMPLRLLMFTAVFTWGWFTFNIRRKPAK